ncbi:TlpA family protein disulfide reductase [Natrinema salsiterrestre]|uniref:TlpA family protein disulfide reductase n=1 Tax=Natrinema salsiterrestre TaxID=2950540 RepID=A0A9Q4L0R7_9EURY|nr:TlpA disulfide reductase family protein [Natrinema salsiterrestre]MDF9745941.1 TlpA family protein disulfide reductase [Natrinema salsiterrestre]
MRRRDVLAGIGSVGVIGGAGALAIRGPPSFDDGTEETEPTADPLVIETVDAPGSEARDVRIPASDRATFLDFFGTWCGPCKEQMPALVEANDRIGDEVRFISVTNEAVGRSVTREELADWWRKYDGNWLLGIDPTAELSAEYSIGGVPYAVAIDSSGRVQWSEAGRKSADELVAGIERALETGETDGGDG